MINRIFLNIRYKGIFLPPRGINNAAKHLLVETIMFNN